MPPSACNGAMAGTGSRVGDRSQECTPRFPQASKTGDGIKARHSNVEWNTGALITKLHMCFACHFKAAFSGDFIPQPCFFLLCSV